MSYQHKIIVIKSLFLIISVIISGTVWANSDLKIVYQSDQSGNNDIWAMADDGSNQTQLTNDSNDEYTPKWSPDGTQIAYIKKNGPNYELWVMDANGNNQMHLSTSVSAGTPVWIEDQNIIIFSNKNVLYSINSDGTSETVFYTKTPYSGIHGYGGWDVNNDGSQIVYAWEDVNWTPSMDIFIYDTVLKTETKIIPSDRKSDFRTQFSYDDQSILWDQDNDTDPYDFGRDVWKADFDGSNKVNLSIDYSGQYELSKASYFPDGSKILMQGRTGTDQSNYDIYIMDADGTNLLNLTNSTSKELNPDYNPIASQENSTKLKMISDDFTDGDFSNNPTWTEVNNDDYPRTVEIKGNALHFLTTGAGGNGGSVGIEIETDIPVTDDTLVTFDGKAVSRSVGNGCGWSCGEFPVNVQITLNDDSGQELKVRYALNYGDAIENKNQEDFKQLCLSVPQNEWVYNIQYSIRDAWPNAIKITKVHLFAAGWSFDGYIDNIRILSQNKPDTSSCDVYNLNLCASEDDCTSTGGNWCDNICQESPCPEPDPICDSLHLGLCYDQTNCELAGGFWCDEHCQITQCSYPEPTCDSANLNLCLDQISCESVGAYWCEGECQPSECYFEKLEKIAIIVMPRGRDRGENQFQSIEFMTTYVYKTLIARHYSDSEIYFLSYNPLVDVNGDGWDDPVVDGPVKPIDYRDNNAPKKDITLEDIQNTFNRAEKHGKLAQPLIFIFIDHGVKDGLQIDPTSTGVLSENDLKSIFEKYQMNTGNKIVAIIEACHSGTLIDALSGKDRVIITSTNEQEAQYEDTGKLSFTKEYFDQLRHGNSFYQSFDYVSSNLKTYGDFFKKQIPQLDDDGDGYANTRQDGKGDSDKFCLNGCMGGTLGAGDVLLEPQNQSGEIVINQHIKLSVKATITNGYIKKVWALLITPESSKLRNEQGYSIDPPPTIELKKSENLWESDFDDFQHKGNYVLFFMVEDFDSYVTTSSPVYFWINEGPEVPTIQEYLPPPP